MRRAIRNRLSLVVLLSIALCTTGSFAKKGTKARTPDKDSPPIMFYKKQFTMGAVVTEIKGLYSGAKEKQDKTRTTLQLDLPSGDMAAFTFDDNYLTLVKFESTGMQGPKDEILGFFSWLKKKYGGGKDIKNKPPLLVRQWKVGKAVVTGTFESYPDTGDNSARFEIHQLVAKD